MQKHVLFKTGTVTVSMSGSCGAEINQKWLRRWLDLALKKGPPL